MTGFVVLVVVILLLLIWLVGRVYSRDATLDPVVKVVQAVLTAFALLLAGLWYFVERKGMSHAELALSADGVRVTDELALVHLRIEIKNVGFIALKAENWVVRLLSIVPTDLPLDRIASDAGWDKWPATIKVRRADGGIEDRLVYYEQELLWRTERNFEGWDRHEIEPGETDAKTMDFLIPCTGKVMRATVAVQKDAAWNWGAFKRLPYREPQREWWWRDRINLNLGALCAKPVGASAKLGIGGDGGEQNDAD